MKPAAALKRLELTNYKGFAKFTVRFSGSGFLVGPNNAGKSTIIHALRGCAHMIDHALARAPTDIRRDNGSEVRAYPFPKDNFSLVTENVRHEFSSSETRLELVFDNDSVLRAVWPSKDDDDDEERGAFFYLETPTGKQPTRPKEVQESFISIGIIPTLMPIDIDEQVLQEDYVRTNTDGRLASRHFRNQLHLLRVGRDGSEGAWGSYTDFVAQWTPEARLTDVRSRTGIKTRELDVFYREALSRTDKEVYWAGDGLQIWLQFLLHIHRLRGEKIIVLDEPDVYLHADLQRRLVRVLEETRAQTITATHSAEILAEAGSDLIVLVDRTRRQSMRAPSGAHLLALSDSLGSQFNLRLARALRSRAVVFVEGKDQKILRHLAKTAGAANFAAEQQVAVIPIEGFSNWDQVVPFKFIVDDLLEKTVPVFAILDRDHRTDAQVDTVTRTLAKCGVTAIVWDRKELESYLLEPAAIARLAKKGVTPAWVQDTMEQVISEMKDDVLAAFLSARKNSHSKKSETMPSNAELVKEFRGLWADPTMRLRLCPAREVLSGINVRLQAERRGAVSSIGLARGLTISELAKDVHSALMRIERAITSRP